MSKTYAGLLNGLSALSTIELIESLSKTLKNWKELKSKTGLKENRI